MSSSTANINGTEVVLQTGVDPPDGAAFLEAPGFMGSQLDLLATAQVVIDQAFGLLETDIKRVA